MLKTRNLASYSYQLDGGPFEIYVFRWKNVFLHKCRRYTAGIKAIGYFYKYRPKYISIVVETLSYLCSWPPSSPRDLSNRAINHK